MKRRSFVVLSLLAVAVVARAEESARPVFRAGMKEPVVAVGPGGKVYVVASSKDAIEVASSGDGDAFGAPVQVARVPGLMVGMRRGPRIAVAGRSVVITAIGKAAADSAAVSLLSWRSSDEGKSWSGPLPVHAASADVSEGLQGLAGGPDDRVACVWLEARSGAGEVYAAVSRDGGATWTERRVYASPDGHVCECCHPSVAWGPDGTLAVMWRNWLGGSRDLWCARSKDDGQTFAAAEKLGHGTWPLEACPMDGGGIAVRSDGALGTVWRREDRMYFAGPGTEEKLLGSGLQGTIASGPGGFYMMWLEKKGGDLLALLPGDTAPRRIASSCGNPSIAGGLKGEGPVVVAWANEGGVFARRVRARE